MISAVDQRRIKEDACIAIDALHALIYADHFEEHYLTEKVETVKNCIKFMENYTEKEKK